MVASWMFWLALAIVVGGLVYFWLRHRNLHARLGGLSNELERRTTELDQARNSGW